MSNTMRTTYTKSSCHTAKRHMHCSDIFGAYPECVDHKVNLTWKQKQKNPSAMFFVVHTRTRMRTHTDAHAHKTESLSQMIITMNFPSVESCGPVKYANSFNKD